MKVDSALHEFRRPEAKLLADLHVVEQDMARAVRYIAPLRIGPTWANFTVDLEEVHWVTAVVAYARPFGTGVLRWDKAAALRKLPPKLAAVHEHVIAVRNGYIAHSVGDMEDPCPVVQVATYEDGTREIRAVLCCSSRLVGPGSHLAESLHLVATSIRETVKAAIADERARLLRIAEQLGVEEVSQANVWAGRADGREPRKARKL